MTIFRRVIGLGLCFCLLAPASARQWTKIQDGDGYRSVKGVVTAKSEPQPASKVVAVAISFMDVPYVWAGTSPESGFDCSGFVYEVMRLNGYEVPRMADYQFEESHRVSRENLKPGDMVFFATYLPGPSHVGIYLGKGKFVHASSAGEKVVVSQLNSGYYKERFLGGGRPDNWAGEPAEKSAVAANEAPAPLTKAPPAEPVKAAPSFEVESRAVSILPPPPSEPEVKLPAEVARRDPFSPTKANATSSLDERVDSPPEEAALDLSLTAGEVVAVAKLEGEEILERLDEMSSSLFSSITSLF